MCFTSQISLACLFENKNLSVFRSLRTLRALRPLRAISRLEGMKVIKSHVVAINYRFILSLFLETIAMVVYVGR